MHKLVIQDDEGKTTVVPLIRDEITVGRKEGNTIRLTERNVSRKHARILRKNTSIAIEDCNSYNGVLVNGSRIQGRVGLSVSDRVQIGDYVIELKLDNGVVAAEPYGDETQPIDTTDLRRSSPNLSSAGLSSPSLSVPQSMAEAPTSKLAAPMTAMMPGAPLAAAAVAPVPAALGAEAMAGAALSPQMQDSSPARLVVLSTNFAGREFELTKPAMVIGRTDDNDMVMNHRSISRHHAKIVRENGRYAIVDLQSSNGVRVNGEEYSKVELRRGDVIDLGHVRFRFIEPGEDFVFGRDAHAVMIPSGGSRGLLYGVFAVLAIGVVAVILLVRGGDEGETKTADKGTATQADTETGDEATSAKPTPASNQDKTQALETNGSQEILEKVKPHIEVARKAIDGDDWATAIKASNEALAIHPQNEEAKQFLSKAQLEQKNAELFSAFQKAIKSKKPNYAAVASTFEAIAPDSIYKNRARDDHDRIRAEYTKAVMAQADAFAKKGKCKELSDLVARSRATWDSVGDEVAAVGCNRPTQVAVKETVKSDQTTNAEQPKDNTPPPPSDEDKQPTDDEESSDDKPTKSYEQLMEEAKEAAKQGQYGKARKQCADALKLRPKDPDAVTLCGLAACNMKNAKLAKKYQEMANPQRKQIIRQFCLKAGLRDFQ